MGIAKILFSGKGSRPVLERAVVFAEYRHKLIANNIANLDTPGYKAKDLDVQGFRNALAKAIEERDKYHPREFIFRGNRNIKEDRYGKMKFRVLTPKDNSILRHDQNNVTVEHEIGKLAKNTLAYQVYMNLLSHEYKMLNLAIRGK